MPERTESGKLKFSLHNLNPLHMYRVLTQAQLNPQDPLTDLSDDHCKNYDSDTKVCIECKSGFFLDISPTSGKYCKACSDVITNCFECFSTIDEASKTSKVTCDSCNFPQMPNKTLDTCVNRTVLMWYAIVYFLVAIVLTVLACLEKPESTEGKAFSSQVPSLSKGLISENSGSMNQSNESF